jgi:tetratricopeptide (TPR) repeat protein
VLALHFEEGRDFVKAVRYLGQAAESSAKRFGNQEAAIYLTRALDLLDRWSSMDQRLTVRIKLLQQRGWARRSAGDFRGSLEDLSNVVSSAAEANQLLTEVKALVDLSWFYLYVDRRRCLEVAERALVRGRALDDDVMAALAQGNSASLNLYLRGWRDEDGDHCRLALKMTGDARDPLIVMRRCAIRIVLAFMNSNYREGCVAAEQGQALAQERGDAYSFTIFNAFGAGFFLHHGAWREMQQSFAAALAVAEKNANRMATPSRLHVAWLHNEALDFEGARKCCEEALNSAVEENPLIFFLGRNLLAKASLGLHDYPAALAQFNAITDRIEADGDYRNLLYPLFHHGFCEYWLAVGDLNRAREQATRLHDIAALPPERAYLALSHRLSAKIAIAEGNLEEARNQLSRAISIVEGGELPLAYWRIHATAAEFYNIVGETSKAAESRCCCEKVIHALAESLDQDGPLRTSLLAGYAAEARL